MQAIDAFVVAADKDVEAIWLAAQMPPTLTLPHEGSEGGVFGDWCRGLIPIHLEFGPNF
jgi:hypothetical protein